MRCADLVRGSRRCSGADASSTPEEDEEGRTVKKRKNLMRAPGCYRAEEESESEVGHSHARSLWFRRGIQHAHAEDARVQIVRAEKLWRHAHAVAVAVVAAAVDVRVEIGVAEVARMIVQVGLCVLWLSI